MFGKYKILGTHRRYGQTDLWAAGMTLREATAYMEQLRRSFGDVIRFKLVEDRVG